MAITIECDTTKTLDLPSFIEEVDRSLDPRDLDSLAACAPYLKALANNRSFVTEELNNQLSCWRDFQGTNRYTSQSMIFGRGKDFFVRANIWTPVSSRPEVREAEERLFFYRVPHDHNFSFLTAGYFGPGYETVIYEYDPDAVSGAVGENAKLQFLERTNLTEGKIMLYRACRDIHSQEHAPAFSVSLNLMVNSPSLNSRSQFLFNLENGTISGLVPTPNNSRMIVCRLAHHLGNARTAELLDGLAASHDSENVRLTAYQALATIERFSSSRIWKRALVDKHPFVRAIARRELGDQS
jgi:hypothetical protein